MPRPCDVYAKELSTLSRGHAVLNPRRAKYQSRGGLRPAIDIGDIVYICNGQPIRLFNCLVPRDQQDEDCVFPDDFEVLELASPARRRGAASRARASPGLTVHETHNNNGMFHSKGVRLLKADAGLSSPVGGGASMAFTARQEQGAVLLTNKRVKTRTSMHRPAFEKYMIQHFDSWCSLLQTLELQVRPEELMLIDGVDTAQSWSNLVYSERELEGEFSVDIPPFSPVEGRIGVRMEFSRTQSATRDSGPDPEDVSTEEEGSDSGYESGDGLSTSASTQEDQVIFVRGLRGKKRSFLGMKIVANAEPQNLEGRDDTNDGESVISLESFGDLSTGEDFLTPVLDFILENSDVDMAIVHDDDYDVYCQHLQADSLPPSSDLIQHRVKDGLAFGMVNQHAGVDASTHATRVNRGLTSDEQRPSTSDTPPSSLDTCCARGSVSQETDPAIGSRATPPDGQLNSPARASNHSKVLTTGLEHPGKLQDSISIGRHTVEPMLDPVVVDDATIHSSNIALCVTDHVSPNLIHNLVMRRHVSNILGTILGNNWPRSEIPSTSSDTRSLARTYTSNTGHQYYIFDVPMDDVSPITLLRRFVPYREQSGRAAAVLDTIEPLPYLLFSNNNGDLGVPVVGRGLEKQVMKRKTTVAVGFQWPGHDSWGAQIPPNRDGHQPGDSETFRHVMDVIPERVNLTFLAIMDVSQGTMMPILRISDHLVFVRSRSNAYDKTSRFWAPSPGGEAHALHTLHEQSDRSRTWADARGRLSIITPEVEDNGGYGPSLDPSAQNIGGGGVRGARGLPSNPEWKISTLPHVLVMEPQNTISAADRDQVSSTSTGPRTIADDDLPIFPKEKESSPKFPFPRI